MKRLISFAGLITIAIFGLTGCDPTGNTSVNNANRAAANNSNGSTLGNAVNTVANTVSNIATTSPDAFLAEAAQGGMAEVELGKLAATKAQDAEVKKFAQMMVDDHSKANAELKTLAAKKNLTLPTDVGSSHKSTMDELKALTGADFDKAYVEAMVDDHETDVAAFKDQAEDSTDPDVKAFAAKTLPTLQKHLDAIKAIQAKMN